MPTTGKCPNVGNCDKANAKEPIVMPDGADLTCPECGTKLMPLQKRGGFPVPLLLGSLALLALLALGGFVVLSNHVPKASPRPTPGLAAAASPTAAPVRRPLIDEPIDFLPGTTTMVEDSSNKIREALPKLEGNPSWHIIVEAHVSPSDSADADQKFSEERAEAVKRFLMRECRIPEERILAKGLGSTHPPRLPNETQREWERRARGVRILLVGE
jgi:outer membrane protein OmpA-like peptidoglycan-associated protein